MKSVFAFPFDVAFALLSFGIIGDFNCNVVVVVGGDGGGGNDGNDELDNDTVGK